MATPGIDTAARRSMQAAVRLALLAVVAVALVSMVHDRAQPRIEATQRAERMARLAVLLGDLRYDNDPLSDVAYFADAEGFGTREPMPVHRARLDGVPVAALLAVIAPDGYSGAIRLLVAVDARGRLLGVRVLEHRETPGLGDAIEERRSDWIHGFDGRALGNPPADRWKVRKDGGDFDQFTGATVTPRAIVRAVRAALLYFDRNRNELFAAPPAAEPRS